MHAGDGFVAIHDIAPKAETHLLVLPERHVSSFREISEFPPEEAKRMLDFVAETALKRPVPALKFAWVAFWMGIVGVLMAALSIISGNASVLYTFYPPLTATAWYYIGLVLVVVASWIWCLIMILAMRPSLPMRMKSTWIG